MPEGSESGGGRAGSWVFNLLRVGAALHPEGTLPTYRRISYESSKAQASPDQDSVHTNSTLGSALAEADDRGRRRKPATLVPGGHPLPGILLPWGLSLIRRCRHPESPQSLQWGREDLRTLRERLHFSYVCHFIFTLLWKFRNTAKSRANHTRNPHNPLSNKKAINLLHICFIIATFLLRSFTVNYSHRDMSPQGALACLPNTRRTFSYLTTIPLVPLTK